MARQPVTRLDYCQFLLSSQINYTLTHFAEHARKWSHDTINRYLAGEKITPRLVWENVRHQITPGKKGCLLFDDTVLDKNYSRIIDPVRRQYSGNEKRVIRGIGLVTCVYVNPEADGDNTSPQFFAIDYRVFDPETDGKTKLDHVSDMLANVVHQKRLPFCCVLMDTWYASMALMKQVERYGKLYYCTIKRDRKVCEGKDQPYVHVDQLSWREQELAHGKLVHLHRFPKEHKVKLFRLAFSSERTDYLVTNDLTQSSTQAAQEAFGMRWKVEQFHREIKQVTGIEQCQCRSGRIQRNHIGCAMLVWIRLKSLAREASQTVYALKHGLLSDYLIQQLRTPSIKMTFA